MLEMILAVPSMSLIANSVDTTLAIVRSTAHIAEFESAPTPTAWTELAYLDVMLHRQRNGYPQVI